MSIASKVPNHFLNHVHGRIDMPRAQHQLRQRLKAKRITRMLSPIKAFPPFETIEENFLRLIEPADAVQELAERHEVSQPITHQRLSISRPFAGLLIRIDRAIELAGHREHCSQLTLRGRILRAPGSKLVANLLRPARDDLLRLRALP